MNSETMTHDGDEGRPVAAAWVRRVVHPLAPSLVRRGRFVGWVFGLMLLAAPAVRADYPLVSKQLDGSDGNGVDSVAGAIALAPALGALQLCAMLVLPVDVYWKIKQPEERFGSQVGDPMCLYSANLAGLSTYVVAEAPIFAGRWLVRQVAGGDAAAPTASHD